MIMNMHPPIIASSYGPGEIGTLLSVNADIDVDVITNTMSANVSSILSIESIQGFIQYVNCRKKIKQDSGKAIVICVDIVCSEHAARKISMLTSWRKSPVKMNLFA